jgi:hypothetical protein
MHKSDQFREPVSIGVECVGILKSRQNLVRLSASRYGRDPAPDRDQVLGQVAGGIGALSRPAGLSLVAAAVERRSSALDQHLAKQVLGGGFRNNSQIAMTSALILQGRASRRRPQPRCDWFRKAGRLGSASSTLQIFGRPGDAK